MRGRTGTGKAASICCEAGGTPSLSRFTHFSSYLHHVNRAWLFSFRYEISHAHSALSTISPPASHLFSLTLSAFEVALLL